MRKTGEDRLRWRLQRTNRVVHSEDIYEVTIDVTSFYKGSIECNPSS
jgi:hypothetical protein